jgi:hypothetical protein
VSARAEELVDLSGGFEPFARQASAASNDFDLTEVCDRCRSQRCPSPWSVNLTQTSDYGTSLALPISLTPANTLLSPIGNPAQAGILNLAQVTNLGLLGNLGLAPVAPGTNVQGVFEDDFQFQSTAGVGYKHVIDEYRTLTLGYTYYQNLHPDVKQLDLMSHTPSVNYAVKLTDRVATAAYYNYAYYFLSGSSFLTQNRVGSLTTFAANERWTYNLGANYANVNFRQGADYLNSDNYAGTLEANRFFDTAQTRYFRLGYGGGYSNAVNEGFSYRVNNFYTMYRFLYGSGNRNEMRLSGGYGLYDFVGADPIQQGLRRKDNIYTAGLFYGRKITDNVQLFAQYTYLNSNSNVSRQLYNSDLFSLGLTYAR